VALAALVAVGCAADRAASPTVAAPAAATAAASVPEVDGGVTAQGVEKVTICHVPPGNPENAHTITVGSPAVPAHMAHGDSEGACTEPSPSPSPEPSPET
jgi:hypothetical protein